MPRAESSARVFSAPEWRPCHARARFVSTIIVVAPMSKVPMPVVVAPPAVRIVASSVVIYRNDIARIGQDRCRKRRDGHRLRGAGNRHGSRHTERNRTGESQHVVLPWVGRPPPTRKVTTEREGKRVAELSRRHQTAHGIGCRKSFACWPKVEFSSSRTGLVKQTTEPTIITRLLRQSCFLWYRRPPQSALCVSCWIVP